MDYSVFMKMHESFDCLGYVVACLDFWKVSFLSQSVEKGTISMLDQKVEIVALLAYFVELKAVLILDKRLNLYLPC